jgi:hypothetical protein
LTEAAAAEEAVKNGDQIANSTRRCAPTRQNRPLFEVSNEFEITEQGLAGGSP